MSIFDKRNLRVRLVYIASGKREIISEEVVERYADKFNEIVNDKNMIYSSISVLLTPDNVMVGDVFIQGGFGGHGIYVLMVLDEDGRAPINTHYKIPANLFWSDGLLDA